MITRDTVARELYTSISDNGFVETLAVVFGKNISVKIPFYAKSCKTELKDINFSVRASNALNRCKIFTIGELITLIQTEDLSSIKNLGKKSINEIRTKLLAFGYERLSEKDKLEFLKDLIDLNCIN